MYDAVSWNNGFSLVWSMIFLDTNKQSSNLSDGDLSAVVVMRHEAIPLAFTDPIWKKYKLGEAFKINDPATKAPAERNPFYNAKEGELMFPGMAIEKLMQRGVTFGCCNVALTIYSGMRGDAVGVDKATAKQEWVSGLIPGFTLLPSGVWGVNRAQEHGCSYCYAS
jgi:intracellular sulfur oxidation DsrE/DsrF family protein